MADDEMSKSKRGKISLQPGFDPTALPPTLSPQPREGGWTPFPATNGCISALSGPLKTLSVFKHDAKWKVGSGIVSGHRTGGWSSNFVLSSRRCMRRTKADLRSSQNRLCVLESGWELKKGSSTSVFEASASAILLSCSAALGRMLTLSVPKGDEGSAMVARLPRRVCGVGK